LLLLLLRVLLCNCCDAAAADASEAISGERSQRNGTSAKPDAGFIVRRRTVSRTHITTMSRCWCPPVYYAVAADLPADPAFGLA